MKSQRSIPLLIIFAGLLAYHNIFPNAFVFDDRVHIRENPHIRHLWPPADILTHSSRPVVTLSLAINYAISGLNPWSYHAINLAVHILAALTLYGVVRRTVRSAWVAGLVALLWEVHPLQTESVTYTIQRGESLMGLFYLLTLYCVVRSRDSARAGKWQVAAVASCALGMASKEVMVTAPVMILLYDRIFLAQSWRGIFKQRWWLYAGLAATWLLLPVLSASGRRALPGWQATAGFAYKGISPFEYALTQPGVILYYLRLTFWPSPLCLDYGRTYGWPLAKSVSDALPSLLLIGGLLTATGWFLRRKPALGFLGAWFFIILSPTSSFVPVADVIFEHRMYLSLAAVVALVVTGGWKIAAVWLRESRRRYVVYGLAGMLVVTLSWLTVQRNKDYRTELSIWADTVAKRPRNFQAHYNLGVVLGRAKRAQEAISHYQEALRINPDHDESHYNLGMALMEQDRAEEAIVHYRQALRINPDYAEAHNNLGLALFSQGKVQEAIQHYERAVQIKPNNPEVHGNLGLALVVKGEIQDGLRHCERATQIKPDYAEGYNNLANALIRVGRTRDAVSAYEKALTLKPDYVEAHNNLGITLMEQGRLDDAIKHYEQALRFDPNGAEAHMNFAVALSRKGMVPQAIEHYRQALKIKPSYVAAHYNWAVLLVQAGQLPEAITQYEQALRIKPDYAEARCSLGILLAQTGKLEEAIKQFEEALRLKPDYADAHNNLGNALMMAGRNGDAIAHYERALQIKPDFPDAKRNLERAQAAKW